MDTPSEKSRLAARLMARINDLDKDALSFKVDTSCRVPCQLADGRSTVTYLKGDEEFIFSHCVENPGKEGSLILYMRPVDKRTYESVYVNETEAKKWFTQLLSKLSLGLDPGVDDFAAVRSRLMREFRKDLKKELEAAELAENERLKAKYAANPLWGTW